MSKQHENCANYANFVLFLCRYFRRAAENADAADGGMGISHGLKTVHRTVFLTAFRVPLLTNTHIKTEDTFWYPLFLWGG